MFYSLVKLYVMGNKSRKKTLHGYSLAHFSDFYLSDRKYTESIIISKVEQININQLT